MTELSVNWQNAISKKADAYIEELKNDKKSEFKQATELGKICKDLLNEFEDVNIYDIDFNEDEIESIQNKQEEDKEKIITLREKIINREATEEEQNEYYALNEEYKELGNELGQIIQANDVKTSNMLSEMAEIKTKDKAALDYANKTIEIAGGVDEDVQWSKLTLGLDAFTGGVITGALDTTNKKAINAAETLKIKTTINEAIIKKQTETLQNNESVETQHIKIEPKHEKR